VSALLSAETSCRNAEFGHFGRFVDKGDSNMSHEVYLQIKAKAQLNQNTCESASGNNISLQKGEPFIPIPSASPPSH
jgi:hypothetical protein